ncbi:MAG: hypothetical protein AAB605_01560 [Patescibacteria group bacterium]
MTALILTQEFFDEAQDAARQLLASDKNVVELLRSRGYFVAKRGMRLPEGSTTIQEFEIEKNAIVLFTVA